jgi:methylated-DNA-[protein]-cysteine S-methyltransferase
LGQVFGELTHDFLERISFAAGDQGLQRLCFCSLIEFKKQFEYTDPDPSLFGLEVVGALLSEMKEYLFGIRKTFSVMIDWDSIAGFQRDVLELTASIPYGEWLTYGAIAKQIGKPSAARAVGHALRDNPMPIIIPCHRVLGAGGELRGYIGGLEIKAFLLQLEGHTVTGHHLTK